MTDEDKGTTGLLNKVIDYFINKEAVSEIEAPTPELTLEDVNQSVQNLQNEMEKLRTPTPEPEPEPEAAAEPETVETEAEQEEEQEEEETVEAEATPEPEEVEEEVVIKKSLSPDQAQGESKKSFMEKLGRDAFGNKL